MERFEIQPVLSSEIPDVASFLSRWRGDWDEGSAVQHLDAHGVERRLRWLLLENPVTAEGPQYGFCVRDNQGIIRGLTLCFPEAFLAADRRLLGLCSGSFFVEPSARILGFYLFKKRYLNLSGYSFFFATTCNTNGAALWQTLGGCAVPNSETEYILPLRLDKLLPTLVNGRTSSRVALGMARAAGRCFNPILRVLERQSADLTVQPCQDWQKLSDLFHRHRSTKWITTDRSAEFLRWRYEQSSPHYPSDTYLFSDKRGNEGWFALGTTIRGRQDQIRGSLLLDAIWPREKMSFKAVFSGIVQSVGAKADAIFFRPRLGLDYGECSRWIVRRRLEAPQAFVITRKGDPLATAASLDLVFADGNSALPIALQVV